MREADKGRSVLSRQCFSSFEGTLQEQCARGCIGNGGEPCEQGEASPLSTWQTARPSCGEIAWRSSEISGEIDGEGRVLLVSGEVGHVESMMLRWRMADTVNL